MESGWYFPTSFDAWTDQNQTEKQNVKNIEQELESCLITDSLLVSQPVMEDAQIKPKKKKKKKKPAYYDTFYDRYCLLEKIIGRGANSLVTLAKENESGKEYAVKIIEKYEGYDRCRVLREIDLLHFLGECPNVLHLYDSYEDNDRFYLIFERMEGGPLLDRIQSKKAFTEREASLVVKDICRAMKFLHEKGIAHRDLKPENILCVNQDQIIPVVICDFNLASGISGIQSVTTPELYTPVGSAEYMAPEVVDAFVGDAEAYDKRCDLWSLGVILYIMLSGRPPFQGRCGQVCAWEDGGSCYECQSMLWHNILDANFSFPDREWANVSMEAKDLISHLLVKEVTKRYSVEDVLLHPWLEMASNNHLNTPEVLSSESYTRRLGTVTSEAIAYRRIISERQNTEDNDHHIITRWSTPPKFGLSPPGKSRLAKRRSLKNKLSSLSIDVLSNSEKYNNDSANNTPVQSPDIGFLIEEEFRKRLKHDVKLTGSVSHDGFIIHSGKRPDTSTINTFQDGSNENTPLSTPRAEITPRVEESGVI